jgi:hypothetical protein
LAGTEAHPTKAAGTRENLKFLKDSSQESGERRHRAWGMEHRVVIADLRCEMWDWAWGLARKGQGEKSEKGKNLSLTERKDFGG